MFVDLTEDVEPQNIYGNAREAVFGKAGSVGILLSAQQKRVGEGSYVEFYWKNLYLETGN